MTLTIKITREVKDANYYSPSKTETFVDVENVDLGSPSLTGKYLRSLADEIDPPKVSYATGGIIPSGTLR